MPEVEPQPIPEKKPRANFYDARQLFQQFGIKIQKRRIVIYDEDGIPNVLIGDDGNS